MVLRHRDAVRAGDAPVADASGGVMRRPRPCGDGHGAACAATTTPWTKSSPPQTPHGSRRSRAPARQAGADRAVAAERLGELDVGRGLGEPQLRVVRPAGQLARAATLVDRRGRPARRAEPRAASGSPPVVSSIVWSDRAVDWVLGVGSCWSWSGQRRTNKKAADPGSRVPRPRGCRSGVSRPVDSEVGTRGRRRLVA